MLVSKYVCLFMLYSALGWIYETIFCTIKNGKWENRGFLYGPICPIYGTGALLIIVIMNATGGVNSSIAPWQVFVISLLGSAVLEYLTSFTLEKLFHAVWWEYSDWPLNLNGRISLFSSLGFGAGGLLIVYVLAPATDRLVNSVSPLLAEILSLIFCALFMVDVTLTVTVLMNFDKLVVRAEDSFNRKMDNLVETAIQKTDSLKQEVVIKKEYISGLSNIAKNAVGRVYAFKHINKARESLGNRILSMIKKKM